MAGVFGCFMSDIRVVIALEIVVGIVVGEDLIVLIGLRSSDGLSNIVLVGVLEEARGDVLVKVGR